MNSDTPATTLQWVPHVPMTVNLRRLFPRASFFGCGDIRLNHATERSSECRPNSLFAVIRGTRADGAQFIRDALANGASSLLVQHPLAEFDVPQCIVPDVRRAFAELCSALMAHPARHLGLVGVTGTNGKTTTTWLVRAILQAAGIQTGLLGTIEQSDGVNSYPSQLTTPGSALLAQRLAEMVSAGSTHAAMELSSHALDQHRTAGTLLDAAVVTNITQDHFDYHLNFAEYRKSKLRIFNYLKPSGAAIVNIDNPGSRSCLDEAPQRVITYGLDQPADVSAVIQSATIRGTEFDLMIGTERCRVNTPLIGRHNVENCLAAAAACSHLGIKLGTISRGIASLASVPGRLESINEGQPFQVLVDYAHTEDALRNCLNSLRPLTSGRLICVIGAGGDRDQLKRPLLGKAGALADWCIVTSDNPRSEDPKLIAQQICGGFAGANHEPLVELDRERAIQMAIQSARPNDCVLIAGKGHETEQIIGNARRHFDDRETARAYLQNCTTTSFLPEPHVALRNSLRV